MSTWSRGVCPSPSTYSSEQTWLLMPKAIVETESLQVSEESALKTVVFKISGVGCVGRFQQVDSVALLVGYPCRILKTPSNCDRNNLAGRLHESSLSETVLSSGRCFSPQLSLIRFQNIFLCSLLLEKLPLLTTGILFRWVETMKQKKAIKGGRIWETLLLFNSDAYKP